MRQYCHISLSKSRLQSHGYTVLGSHAVTGKSYLVKFEWSCMPSGNETATGGLSVLQLIHVTKGVNLL